MGINKKAIDSLFRDLEKSETWDDQNKTAKKLREFGINHFKVSGGASKLAIVFPKQGIVFKWCYQDNETIDEAVREVEIYNEAIKASLDCFFPKTELYHCEGVTKNIAMQEKIDYSVNRMPPDEYLRYKKIIQTVSPDITEKAIDDFLNVPGRHSRILDRMWAAVAISLYGKKKVKSLCKFVQEHQINDLHASNVGFKNKRPMILDFSGYYR